MEGEEKTIGRQTERASGTNTEGKVGQYLGAHDGWVSARVCV